MLHHANQKINQQSFENSFHSDNIDWLSILLEQHKSNASNSNIIGPISSSFVLRKIREVTNNSPSRVVRKNDTKSNTDFATSNSGDRKILDNNHNSCQYHSSSINIGHDLLTLLRSTPHSSNTIYNISKDNTNNYKDKFTTVSSTQNPIPTSKIKIILIVKILKENLLNPPHKI